jgi:molybdopterin converting factor small subunit
MRNSAQQPPAPELKGKLEQGELEMSVTIEIPTAFRRFTGGAPKLNCSATTVAEALNELTTRFPDLSRHVRDDQGQIRQFLNVYLNEEDIRFLGGETCSLKEGDRVLLIPSIAGG